jgi:type VI secretion system protein ImpA
LNGENYEGTLIRPIQHILITQGSSAGPFALWQYQQALENSKLHEEDDKKTIDRRRTQGSTFLADIEIALKESKHTFYESLILNLSESKKSLMDLNRTIESKAGLHSFSNSQIVATLDTFQEHITYLLKEAPFKITLSKPEKIVVPEQKIEEGASFENEIKAQETQHCKPSLKQQSSDLLNKEMPDCIQNREQALALLLAIADFFKRTEPQSPLPYLLQRTINLGRLSFPDLLKALVNEEGARKFTYDLLGIEEVV